MFARSSSWTGSPEALQKWEDNAPQVAAMVAGLAGTAGTLFLVDRAGGTALTVTLWENEEAALVSDQYAESSRAATVTATGVELAERGRYEVVYQALR
jgi:hypothetical protein